jgi:hypothetical protein
MVNTVLGRITSSLSFQYNQPEMMVQVRVQIAFFDALLQPLNVALGLNYFDNCSEATAQTLAFDKRLDGYIAKMVGTASDSESVGRAVAAAANTAMAARAAAAATEHIAQRQRDAAATREAGVAAHQRTGGSKGGVRSRGRGRGRGGKHGAGCASEDVGVAGGAAVDSGVACFKVLVEWWEEKEGGQDLFGYTEQFSEGEREALLAALEANTSGVTSAVGVYVVPAIACAVMRRRKADVIACAIVDGRPGQEPLMPSESGVYYSADVYAAAICVCEKIIENPKVLFTQMRPSVRIALLMPLFPPVALQRIRDWEVFEYKRPARNAAGDILLDCDKQPLCLRNLEDAQLSKPTALMQKLFDRVNEGGEEALRLSHVEALCTRAKKEWEKMNKKELEGAERPENRTAWKKEALDPIPKNTMPAEPGIAASKQVRRVMQHGSVAREKARTNCRMSGCWKKDGTGTLDKFSEEEKVVLLALTEQLTSRSRVGGKGAPSYFSRLDSKCKAAHDLAAARRRLRALEGECTRLAKEYAQAKVYHKCELYSGTGVLAKKLSGLKFRYQKLELLQNQMAIITIGGGFYSLAFKKGKKSGFCECCGGANDDELAHCVRHVQKCYRYVDGKWPDAPPRPHLTIRKLPPIHIDQEHPLREFILRVENQAMARVNSGKVHSDIQLVDESVVPQLTAAFVGRRIEYIFLVPMTNNKSKRTTKCLCCYRGTINAIGVTKVSVKQKTVVVQSVIVEWDEEEADEDKVSPVNLEPSLHCSPKLDGWAILELDETGGTKEKTVIEKMQQLLVEADMLLPKQE